MDILQGDRITQARQRVPRRNHQMGRQSIQMDDGKVVVIVIRHIRVSSDPDINNTLPQQTQWSRDIEEVKGTAEPPLGWLLQQ